MNQLKRPAPFAGLKRRINSFQLKVYIFLHRSRRQPYALYDDQAPPKKPRGLTLRLLSFGVTLALLTVLALIYPLRPTYSDQEHRNLAAFPSFSLSALADGEYFSGISTWFADTFPLRDVFLSIQHRVGRLYGVQSQKITGAVTQGDEIPVVAVPDDDEDEIFTPPVTPAVPVQPAVNQPEDQPAADQPEDQPAVDQPEDPPAVPDDQSVPPEDGETAVSPDAQPGEDESEPPSEKPEEEDDDLTIPALSDDAVVEQLSAVLSIDNAAYEYYNFVLDYADDYTSVINRAAEQLDGISNVYSIIVPNSMGICVPEDIQDQVNTSDQKAAIQYMNSCFNDKVRAVPVYNTLLKHYLEGEYLYFRTDHHWTALGAYRAYEKFAEAAGFEPTPLDRYILHEYTGFLGTFYNSTKSEAMENTPDTVYAYEAPSTNNIHITNSEMSDWLYLVIGNVDRASAGNKYGTFIGGDNPFSYIENPNLDDGSAVMLIKESYGNAFAPFLIENYQYVYIVDYRYISQVDSRKLAQMCEDLNVRDVLFLNTISTTRAKSLIDKLDSFVG